MNTHSLSSCHIICEKFYSQFLFSEDFLCKINIWNVVEFLFQLWISSTRWICYMVPSQSSVLLRIVLQWLQDPSTGYWINWQPFFFCWCFRQISLQDVYLNFKLFELLISNFPRAWLHLLCFLIIGISQFGSVSFAVLYESYRKKLIF